MVRLIRQSLAVVWLAAALACNGDKSPPKATSPDGGTGTAGSSGGDGGLGPQGNQTDAGGATPTGDGGAPPTTGPTVPVIDPNAPIAPSQLPTGAALKRLVPDDAFLVGGVSCNHQDVATGVAGGDRWCAFARLSAAGEVELWALNVTKAVAGAVACDGKDPSCLLLTNDLWADDLTAHGFNGDTLLFRSPPVGGGELYRGKIFVWRPGWAAARAVTNDTRGFTCEGSVRGPVVFCLERERTAQAGAALVFDLHAGTLPDGGGAAGSLPLVGPLTVVRADGAEADFPSFSPAGGHLLYSTFGAGAAGDPEVLFSRAVTDLGGATPPTELGRGLSVWQLAPDGAKLYYLKDYNYETGVGTLTSADFPSGANPATVAPRVGRYSILGADPVGSKALAFVQDLIQDRGRLQLISDRTSTGATAVEVARDVIEFTPTPGFPGLAYIRRFTNLGDDQDPVYATDLNLHRLDGAPGCTFQAEPYVRRQSWRFSSTGGLLFWSELTDQSISAWYASPADCNSKKTLGQDTVSFQILPTKGFIYEELVGQIDGVLRTRLRHVPLADGNTWPTAAPLTLFDRILPGAIGLPGGIVLFNAGPDAPQPGLHAISGL